MLISRDDLRQLEALHYSATPGPWHVCTLDDEHAMQAVAITTRECEGSMRDGSWPSDAVVATCLIQQPPYVVALDQRYDENAKLIAAVRNHLPELLQLAQRGLDNDEDARE